MNNQRKCQLSIVIPVFRGKSSLRELYQRLLVTLQSLNISFEILFVEDCGGDNSWELILELAQEDNRVCGLRLSRNFGQHNALLAGIIAADGVLVATLDDDLQHPPEELPKLIDKIQEGYDVIYGASKQGPHGFFRNLASKITKITLQSAMGVDSAQNVSAFRVFRTQLRSGFEGNRIPEVNIDVLLAWTTTKFATVFIRHEIRKYGKSGYTTCRLLSHTMNMMTGLSTAPLKLASMTGFVFALFGFFVLVYIILRYFIEGVSVPGFAFLASIISLFSGAQLLALGIIGEYLARMHQKTMDRPTYLVSETTLPAN